MGAPLKAIVESLSKKYGTKEKQLYQDWERRHKWMPQIVQLDDPTLLHEHLQGILDEIPKLWIIAEGKTDDGQKYLYRARDRLEAFKEIKDIHFRVLEILQSVGVVEKKPIQVDQKVLMIKGRWWKAGSEVHPELKKGLVEEAERQKKEHDQQRQIPLS
jgi:hypothetical protein